MPARIISGLLKGIAISAPKGLDTRPTSSMVREAILAIVGERAQGASALDLFAGSGAMGLEAVSRGAASAVLCDKSIHAMAAIRQNMERLPDWAKAKVKLQKLVLPGQLQNLSAFGPFSLVFLDPPYADIETPLATLAKLPSLCAPGALAIWEQDAKTPKLWEGAPLNPWTLSSLRRWGSKAAAFLELAGTSGSEKSLEASDSHREASPETGA